MAVKTLVDTDSVQTLSNKTLSGVQTTITFPAVQVPSADVNTLDDYEEGTWTPSVGGTATYTTQDGTYIKIGKLVFVRCHLVINVIGTGATNTIDGVPFIVAQRSALAMGNSESLAVSPVALEPVVGTSSTIIYLYGRTAAAASTTLQAILGDGASVTISGCYSAQA
jgi:hypothetical protein